MVAYSFKSRFSEAVESGRKRQTIRALGKRRHARQGEAVQLYTGMRTRYCRKLVTPDPVCVSSLPIYMDQDMDGRLVVVLAGSRVDDLEGLAKADGFHDAVEFREFFERNHELPFEGRLIRWKA
ncbi:hypothetical protein [Desulfocurvibacter africanus]|uniref:hypothetical protein n=1 Tax=Desulfocurvibacter africanus TaxID=873 RepID=UPI000411D690|nr:hypothetical protein [Desulfocurvibacter africanus]